MHLNLSIDLVMYYLIIFGGNIVDNNTTRNLCGIYGLDLDCDDGWKEMTHLAILTADKLIHLVSEINVWPNCKKSKLKHYSIHVSTILGLIAKFHRFITF